MKGLDVRSRSLFCTPLDAPVHKRNAEWIKINISKNCDTFQKISNYLSTTTNPRLRVVEDDVQDHQPVTRKNGRVTVVVGMHDVKRKPGHTYVPGVEWKKHLGWDLSDRAIGFAVFIRNRPGFSESKKRVLKMRVYIGATIVGECLPMPLYFYNRSDCPKVSDAVIEEVSEYEHHLRIYFEPHPKLSWEAFRYSKLMYPITFDPKKRLRPGKHVTFRYHDTTKTIVSTVK
jgi:hypothetical protein